jgi:hypothetical protein
MLAWLDARFARRLLAEIQKPPDFVSEVRERHIVNRLPGIRCHPLDYIVIRYYLPQPILVALH